MTTKAAAWNSRNQPVDDHNKLKENLSKDKDAWSSEALTIINNILWAFLTGECPVRFPENRSVHVSSFHQSSSDETMAIAAAISCYCDQKDSIDRLSYKLDTILNKNTIPELPKLYKSSVLFSPF